MSDQEEFVFVSPYTTAYPAHLFRGSPPSVPSDTSEEAAESVKESSNSMRAQVFRYIQTDWHRAKGGGWTDDELERATGFRHQTVSARRRELVLLGRVKDSGRRRKTRSGRSATVWIVA